MGARTRSLRCVTKQAANKKMHKLVTSLPTANTSIDWEAEHEQWILSADRQHKLLRAVCSVKQRSERGLLPN